MPWVNGEYVMPEGMFEPWPEQSSSKDCIDPLCDECVRRPSKRRRPSGEQAAATSTAAEGATATAAASTSASASTAASPSDAPVRAADVSIDTVHSTPETDAAKSDEEALPETAAAKSTPAAAPATSADQESQAAEMARRQMARNINYNYMQEGSAHAGQRFTQEDFMQEATVNTPGDLRLAIEDATKVRIIVNAGTTPSATASPASTTSVLPPPCASIGAWSSRGGAYNQNG